MMALSQNYMLQDPITVSSHTITKLANTRQQVAYAGEDGHGRERWPEQNSLEFLAKTVNVC